jgi:hypothetical protein
MGLTTARKSPGIPRKPEVLAEVDPEFLEHLRYEDLSEPEPPWDD